MRIFFVAILAATGLGAAMAGCSSRTAGRPGGVLLPPALPEGATGISETEVSEARSLYVAKCAKCHRFHHPADYSAMEWDHWFKKMSRKSKLTLAQAELLSHYLGLFRRAEPAPKADL